MPPAKAGFFVSKDHGEKLHATPWSLVGQARRIAMTLHDLRGYLEMVGAKERMAVLNAVRPRVAEARRVREELLARDERIVAAMLTAALEQFLFAGAN